VLLVQREMAVLAAEIAPFRAVVLAAALSTAAARVGAARGRVGLCDDNSVGRRIGSVGAREEEPVESGADQAVELRARVFGLDGRGNDAFAARPGKEGKTGVRRHLIRKRRELLQNLCTWRRGRCWR